MGRKKTAVILAAVFAIFVLFVTVRKNYDFLSCAFSGLEPEEVSMDDVSVTGGKKTENGIDLQSGSSIRIDCGNRELKSVYIVCSMDFPKNRGNVIFEADAKYKYKSGDTKERQAGRTECISNRDILIPMRTQAPVAYAYIDFGNCVDYGISQIKLNYGGEFAFPFKSVIIFLILMLVIYFVITGRLYEVELCPDSKAKKMVFAFCVLVCVFLSVMTCVLSIHGEFLTDYPLEKSVDEYGCYIQMFDAFKKGQLNIDTDFDLSRLEALENPYDFQERLDALGNDITVVWDRAYYNGKLYSYFGAAPVIMLYFPVYFLTGHVFSDAAAAMLISAVTNVFLLLLLWELCRRYAKHTPFLLFLTAAFALPFGSLIYSSQTCANFYHTAVMAGICFTVMFLYFVLKAEHCRDGIKRKIFFVLAGIFLASAAGSRPNTVFYVLVALPVLISIIIKRPNGTKSLVFDIISFCVPLLSLGGLIMAYNYARFGSVFDFGNSYQLTLADTSLYTLSLSMLFPALYHYFLQPPEMNGIFPYVHPSYVNLGCYGTWTYLYRTVGALFFPAVWGNALMIPLSKKDTKKRLTLIMSAVAVFALAFTDMCFGGVHLRYQADIMFMLCLTGSLLILQFVSECREKGNKSVFPLVFALCMFAFTVMMNIPLCLDNERDMIMNTRPEFYYGLFN